MPDATCIVIDTPQKMCPCESKIPEYDAVRGYYVNKMDWRGGSVMMCIPGLHNLSGAVCRFFLTGRTHQAGLLFNNLSGKYYCRYQLHNNYRPQLLRNAKVVFSCICAGSLVLAWSIGWFHILHCWAIGLNGLWFRSFWSGFNLVNLLLFFCFRSPNRIAGAKGLLCKLSYSDVLFFFERVRALCQEEWFRTFQNIDRSPYS